MIARFSPVAPNSPQLDGYICTSQPPWVCNFRRRSHLFESRLTRTNTLVQYINHRHTKFNRPHHLWISLMPPSLCALVTTRLRKVRVVVHIARFSFTRRGSATPAFTLTEFSVSHQCGCQNALCFPRRPLIFDCVACMCTITPHGINTISAARRTIMLINYYRDLCGHSSDRTAYD